MSDTEEVLLVQPNDAGEGDLVWGADGLASGPAIQTAAYLSLFTDAPARPNDPLPEGAERRGFWADAYEDEGDVFGSRLWLIEHLTINEALSFAPQAAEEALAWMVRDGLADRVFATAERNGGRLTLSAYILRPQNVAPSLMGAWNFEAGHALG